MNERLTGSGASPAGKDAIRAAWFFPARRIEIQACARTFAVTLSRRAQLLILLLLVATAAATGYVGVDDLAYREELHARRAETLRAEAANTELRAYAARLRRKLARMTRQLAAARARIAAREAEADGMRAGLVAAQQQLQQLSAAPAQAASAAGPQPQGALAASPQDQRIARLDAALVAVERRQQEAAAQRADLASRLAAAQSALARATEQAAAAKHALAQLTTRLAAREHALAAPPAGARTAAATAPGILGKIEQALAAAGIDAKRIFASFGINRDVGGPFIPARDAPSPAQLAAEQAAVLRMLKTLPVDAPLSHYRETSPFGPRVDPINDREGFHPGVDLAAPYGSPVYATAPGVVTFAGWDDGYGKIVRIDHGHGLSTGYAHLHRYTVVVGERVAAGTVIGYVGTTGRTTGPHVHYEVRLNGKPVNPAAFLALGHEIIPAAAVASAAAR